MPALPYNAMHAAVDPRGVLIRDHLAEVGEAHGRTLMALALDRVLIVDEASASAVLAIIVAEAERMATLYADAGCSRRQIGAFSRAYYRGVAARNAAARALLASAPHGSA